MNTFIFPHPTERTASAPSFPTLSMQKMCVGRVGGIVTSRSHNLTLSAGNFYLHSLALP